jgi:hypothetical protein
MPIGCARASDDVGVPRIWRIELLVETDDAEKIERIADLVGNVACPHDPLVDVDHACPVPWFVITSPLDEDEAVQWRDELNR